MISERRTTFNPSARWRGYYRASSPIRQADKIDVPALHAHGVRDPRVDIAESEATVRALRGNGVGLRAEQCRVGLDEFEPFLELLFERDAALVHVVEDAKLHLVPLG